MLTTSFAKKVSRVVVPGPPNKLRQIDASSPIPPNGYDGANGRFLAPFVAELPFRFRPNQAISGMSAYLSGSRSKQTGNSPPEADIFCRAHE
jgi:hypothetical protein